MPPLAPVHDLLQKGPESSHYFETIFKIIQDVDSNRPFIVTESGKQALQQLDMFEWSTQYPPNTTPRQVPYFVSDSHLHDQLAQAYEKYGDLARVIPRESQRAQRRAYKRAPQTASPDDSTSKLVELQAKIDALHGQLFKRHHNYDVLVGDAHIRFSPFGRAIRDGISKMSPECSVLTIKVLSRAEQIDPAAKMQWRKVLEHTVKLSRLPNPELHLRKLNIGIIQKSIDLTGESLERRFKQIEAESHVDKYLQSPKSTVGGHALRWLQSSNGGNFCPAPYPSWQEADKRECQEQSKRIVTRARLHSYTTFQKLRIEARHLCGEAPLFQRFARETHEQFQLAHGKNIDVPPGRGMFMAGPRLERLFHADALEPDDALANYREANAAWWEPALPDYENTSAVFLRSWFAIFNPTPDFSLFGTRYAIVVDNNHFTDLYGCAYGIPASIITKKIHPSLHNPDRKPTKRTADLGERAASVSGLIEATVDAGLPPLVLGTMSQLFGGMTNALPVGYPPTLSWERDRQGGLWKDVYNHVHWSWLVWDIRQNRPHVDFKVAPMAQADQQIRRFATKGQQLVHLTLDRYAAWKNDQTPGEKSAPTMLQEAYKIHKAYQSGHASLPQDETLYIGIYDRETPGTAPAPVINCRTLEIMRKGGNIKLPTWSDGTENNEALLWKQHIKPLLVNVDKHGIAREGQYELAIVGDKDLTEVRYDTKR